MDLQKAIEAFLNTNELASSDQMHFDKLVSAFSSCRSKYSPLKRASRKKSKLMTKPWITKGMFISIRQKQKLSATHYLKGNEIQKEFYKIYANNLPKSFPKSCIWNLKFLI